MDACGHENFFQNDCEFSQILTNVCDFVYPSYVYPALSVAVFASILSHLLIISFQVNDFTIAPSLHPALADPEGGSRGANEPPLFLPRCSNGFRGSWFAPFPC